MVSKTAPLPDVRNLFIPNPGMIICEADLIGADAQVVAWEADDEDLKAAFRAGLKVHAKNALDMFGPARAGPDGKKEPLYTDIKQVLHATDYAGKPPGISRIVGWSIAEVDLLQRRWFGAHPGIKDWHRRTERELLKTRGVENKFGYKITYFDRVNGLLPEALAWKPQSTVALVCFKGARNIKRQCSWVKLRLQVHDSLVFEYPEDRHEDRHLIQEALHIEVPYDDPLVIPWGLKCSHSSWGEAKDIEWREGDSI